MKNRAGHLIQGFVIALALLSFAACKKNDNSGAPPPPPPVAITPQWQSCASCPGVIAQGFPGLVGVRSSTTNENVLFAFDLIVDQANTMVNWADPKAILYYTGPVALQGTLRVVAANDINVCNAPPGDYDIRPLTSSSVASGGILSYGTFEALGPTRIVFRVGSSAIYNAQDPGGVSRNSQSNRIQFNLMLDSVNNIYCGPLATR